MKAPILIRIEQQKKIAQLLSPYIGNEVAQQLDVNQIHIEPAYCAEFYGYGQPASNAFLDAMFPRWSVPAELFHYTKMERLLDIARSGELWLFALRKRVDEGELSAFGDDHKLKGFFERTKKGEAYYKELSDDLFYTSFAPDQRNEEELWPIFGGGGSGVRLKMRLITKAAELRAIQYATPFRTALMELNGKLEEVGLPPFAPWTISRIGGFYLRSDLSYENEVRLLIKRHRCGRDDARKHSSNEYWPVPIGVENDVCEIELLEIQLGPQADRKAAETAIAGTRLRAVKIVSIPDPNDTESSSPKSV